MYRYRSYNGCRCHTQAGNVTPGNAALLWFCYAGKQLVRVEEVHWARPLKAHSVNKFNLRMEINPKPTQSSSGEGIISGGENITFGQGVGGQRKDVTGVGGPSGAVIGVDMSRTSTPGAGPSTTPLPSKAGTPGATPQTPATAREEEDQATADSSAGRSWEVQLASRKRKWGMMGFTKEEQDIMEQDSLS